PNCYGVINYLDGALLWPDQHGGRPVEKGVALVSQSSNIVINLTMQTRGLPVAYVACLGNAAQIGLAELSSALLADPRVTALGLYVEGFDDAAAFTAMAEAARLAGKGIVCLKTGKTEASRQAAASHTASLAGGGAASSAFLRQAGVAEVTSLEHMLETLKIFHCYGPMIGPRLCSLSCSGGEVGLVADLAATHQLRFEPLPQAQSTRLAEILGSLVTISNPLDYNTFIWGDGPRTTDVFTTMLSAYDVGIYIIDPPRPDRCDPASYQPALDSVIVAGQSLGKPAFPVASLPENFDEERAIALINRGIAPLMGLEAALGSIKAAQTPAPDKGWRPFAPLALGESHLLGEDQAKALLAQAGILVPKGVSAPTLAALLPQV
ncbi:MAG: CoA-binding protein, partial [Paracoccaceae bacterium]